MGGVSARVCVSGTRNLRGAGRAGSEQICKRNGKAKEKSCEPEELGAGATVTIS